MQVIRQLPPPILPQHNRTVLTIGSYDGIHRGHKRIITQLKQAAAEQHVSTALVTFYPRPKVVLGVSKSKTDYLTTLEEKLWLLESLGLDIVAVLPFSREFAQTPARDFVKQLVDVFHPIELWVGPNFKLGREREGNISFLRALGNELEYKVKVVDEQKAGDQIISSTRIRAAMTRGDIRSVTRLLGDYPFLMGRVMHGTRRGRTIGFPTANIVISEEKLLPVNGVYAVWIHIGNDVYPAVANIGVRPTFEEATKTVEVHIFNFKKDIYNKMVRVQWVEFLRPEHKFANVNALVAQIKKDAQQAQKILSTEKRPQ